MSARRLGHPLACFTERVQLEWPLEAYPFRRTYIRATADDPDALASKVFEAAAEHARSSPDWDCHEIASNHVVPSNRPVETDGDPDRVPLRRYRPSGVNGFGSR